MPSRNQSSSRTAFWLVIALGATALSQACANRADDCDANSTCPPMGGTSTAGTSPSAGKAGGTAGSNAGDGGSSAAGSSTGGTPAHAGEGGNFAGEGGTASALPCSGACTTPTPVCNEATNACVECLAPADCTTGDENLCDVGSNTCVECLDATTDCATATASRCEGGACAPCQDNNDCAHIAGKTVCDTAAGECVQCTGTDYASCGIDLGVPLVCDSRSRVCTTNKEHAADLCKPCVSDAHCKLGELCVLEKYDGEDVGYFCFWKQGDVANGAPADCFTEAHPYAGVSLQATSVDGSVADICSLRSSTCVARNQFSSKDCKSGSIGDNSLCGFDPPNDAKCDQVGVSANYRCTMTCGSDEDCPGVFACNTSTGVCEL